MKVTYKEKTFEIDENIKVKDLLKEEIENSKYEIMGCKINNKYETIEYEINKDCNVDLIDVSQNEGSKIYRRTLLYVMGKAIKELYPNAWLTINYQLLDSMFCEISNMEVTQEVIEKVSAKMREIVNKKLPIKRVVMTRKEAEDFYKKNDSARGKIQLELKDNKQIELYFCEDYFNYFFGMLAANTGNLDLFRIEKYEDGFLISYPSSRSPLELPEKVENKKLSWALNEYDDIHKILDVNTVAKLNKTVRDKKVKDVIMIDEALHEKKIAGIADEIAKRKDVKMILIAGPSSSGKTTFAQRLGIQLKINGLRPVTISVDNYFVERPDTPRDENGNYDFESIDAIDTKLFNSHLTKLLNGEEVEMPTFDFYVGTKRYEGNKIKMEKGDVLVIEGIHCLNDKLTNKISKEQKYKIYISALTVLNMDYCNRISTRDNRLIRRIVRDHQFRGYSAKHTIETWNSVTRGEEKNIFPFQEEADSMFNTSLIYELGVLKTVAMPLLEEIKQEEPEYAEAQRLLNMLKYFESIPAKLVPTNSLLKEFLGGGDFKY